MQAALSQTQLASDAESSKTASARPAYHIPTPEAKQVLQDAEYQQLYPHGAYSDPVTYLRSSQTVEESNRGPAYCLDEDDNDWLQDWNKKASEALAVALKSARSPIASAKGKGKERTREEIVNSLVEENGDLRVISEDEFEMVITVFERVSAEQVPFAHLDVSRLPSLEDLLPSFDPNSSLADLAQPELPELPWEHHTHGFASSSKSDGSSNHNKANGWSIHQRGHDNERWSPDNPFRNLASLKGVAKIVYPWWKQRREERQGKQIVPALNFDESNDNDPYVCFRRREVKTIRKTRKTDAMHLHKLIKLRAELDQAAKLMSLVVHRERTKRASLAQDRVLWEKARDLLEVKRTWNIVGPNNGAEDLELVSGERRAEHSHGVSGAPKKKKKVEEQQQNNVVKLPNRKPTKTTSGEENASAAASVTSATASGPAAAASQGFGQAILERVQAVQAYIERECQRKRDSDVGWEEGTDAAMHPFPVPSRLRLFRPIHSDPPTAEWSASQRQQQQQQQNQAPSSFAPWSSSSPSNRDSKTGPVFLPPHPRAGKPPSFRRRVGRGGRVHLDRRLPTPSPVPTSLSDWPRALPPVRQGRGEDGAQGEASKTAKSGDGLNASDKTGTAQQQSLLRRAAPLTGPFAFSPSLRPSLLTSSTTPALLTSAGPFASSAAGPASSERPYHHSSDASSSSSASSQESKASNATFERAASTQPTDLDENEVDDDAHENGAKEDEEEEEGRREGHENEDDEDEEEGEKDFSEQMERDAAFWNEEDEEQWHSLQEKWRYDHEGGQWAGLGLCGLGGMEDDDEAVIDDFDQRFLKYRITLLEESDLIKLSTVVTNVNMAQAAVEAMPPQPTGYSIFRSDGAGHVYHQQQLQAQHQAAAAAAAAQQQQQQLQQQQLQQMQQAQLHSLPQQHASFPMQQQQQQQAAAAAAAAAVAAANAGGANGSGAGLHSVARAAHTNVGGPLTALQQQQQMYQAQLQLALQQQQQRAAQAAAMAAAQQNGGAQSPNGGMGAGGSSPTPRPRSGQMQHAQPHPLSQSFGNGVGTGVSSAGSNMSDAASPINANALAAQLRQRQEWVAHSSMSPPQFPQGIPQGGWNVNAAGGVPSPQIQAQFGPNSRPSSSQGGAQTNQGQQRSSPLLQNGAPSFQAGPGSSPGQNHALPMSLANAAAAAQQQRNGQSMGSGGAQQRPMNNGFMANGMPQVNPLAAAALQQQLQAQQNQQQHSIGQPGNQQQTTVQQLNQLAASGQLSQSSLLAMQAALSANQNLQLKLPPNRTRALQIAQQAAKNAQQQQGSPTPHTGMGLMQGLQQQQQQQQQVSNNFGGQQAAAGGGGGNPLVMGNGNQGLVAGGATNSPKAKGRT